ncbi:hypothetical protein [Rhizosphaericola mali]|uniref:Uncharacterized protein n=1 Tax=Rhizosphaericola mali TaxID=2545455 RepID=A0A5P2G4T4_9BACT|nr:hypothetical protein [Rhizosphaericola mali]QES88832.1 hypothetical protein E0W69_009260 [Rhizosphaericola mali]
MAKVTSIKFENSEKSQELTNRVIDAIAGKSPEEKEIEIKSATLKDEMCDYTYELLTGKSKGDVLSRDGVHIVHEDLSEAFKELLIFVAHIDGVFAHFAQNDTPLKDLEAKAIVDTYNITGFKISGVEENKSVVLYGSKNVQYGKIPLTLPKIKFSGSYLYIEELQNRLYKVLNEVELYMEGKHNPEYIQTEMFGNYQEENADYKFEEAKVK